jgi:hypothetical protein
MIFHLNLLRFSYLLSHPHNIIVDPTILISKIFVIPNNFPQESPKIPILYSVKCILLIK